MTKQRSRSLVLALVALAAANTAFALDPAPAKTDAPVSAAKAGVPIEYAELATQVGAEISVETTLNTVRRGTLVKYTNPTLTLKLGPQTGSIDFTVPRETVRSITLITPAPEPAAKEPGSAQKN